MFKVAQAVENGSQGQDRVHVADLGSRAVLCVADGAGGRSGGAEAAEWVLKLVREKGNSLASAADCEQLLHEADTAISADRNAGETTAVLAVVSLTGVMGAGVGDSGAWIASDGEMIELTRNQVRKPFLGTGVARPTGFSNGPLRGTLLLATDGLLKYAAPETIGAVLREVSLRDIPTALIGLVRYPSGALPDDVGIAVCRMAA